MSQAPKRTRTRTGCLTCRTRRVKCDERKPTCMRCEVVHVECAGYAQKKQVVLPSRVAEDGVGNGSIGLAHLVAEAAVSGDGKDSSEPRASPSSPASIPVAAPDLVPASGASTSAGPPAIEARFRPDGLPLVGLPNTPRLTRSQRPCAAARPVLAYHQFLFRTLPVLFPTEHMLFWRDWLCEEAWGTQYVFLAMAALGGMHRSVLMMSMPSEIDRTRGLDNNIVAVKTYTNALHELSASLDEAKKLPDVLTGTLLLMAYFECFAGNIPAVTSLVHAANHYFTIFKSNLPQNSMSSSALSATLEAGFQNIGWSCHMALPLPNGFSFAKSAPSNSLRHSILNVLIECKMEDLIWVPVQLLPLEKIRPLQDKLREWKHIHGHLLPTLDSDSADMANLVRINRYEFPIPPPPYLGSSHSSSLAGALYSFLMARTMWALCLLGEERDRELHEWAAYLHFHETLRFAANCTTQTSTLLNDSTEIEIACEALDSSILPILYTTAQCSPRPSWLRWISEAMEKLGQQGLFNGHVFAASLTVLHNMESNSNLLRTEMMDRYPDPAHRIISLLIPETAGPGSTCYFTRPQTPHGSRSDAKDLEYCIIGHVHLVSSYGEGGVTRDVKIYKEQHCTREPFPFGWLVTLPDFRNWQRRATTMEFDLESMLRDHINGSSLLSANRHDDGVAHMEMER